MIDCTLPGRWIVIEIALFGVVSALTTSLTRGTPPPYVRSDSHAQGKIPVLEDMAGARRPILVKFKVPELRG